jgi:hypothetical protein
VLACLALAVVLAGACSVLLKVWFWGAVAVALSAAAAGGMWRQRRRLAGGSALAAATALCCAVLALQYAVFFAPLLTRAEWRRPAAAAINAAVPPGETLYAWRVRYLPELSYVRQPFVYLTEPNQVDGRVRYLLSLDAGLGDPLHSRLAGREVAVLERRIKTENNRDWTLMRLGPRSVWNTATTSQSGPSSRPALAATSQSSSSFTSP